MTLSEEKVMPLDEPDAPANGGEKYVRLKSETEPVEISVERVVELALLLSEREVRENQSIILDITEGDQYHIGMLEPSNFVIEKNVAMALRINTEQLHSQLLSKEQFEHLISLAYNNALADRRLDLAANSQNTSRESVAWSTVNPNSKGTALITDRSLDLEESRGFRATLDEVLREGARSGASDMHFKPGPVVGTIQRRIDGTLYNFAKDVPRDDMERLTRALADLAGVNAWKLAHADRDSSITMLLPTQGGGPEVKTRLRFAAVPGLDGVSVSVRFVSQRFRDFDEMGYEPEQQELFSRALKHRNGLVLVTGETGSGKSTVLEAMLRRLESKGNPNVINVSDPIEYENHLRIQIEVKPDYTYAQALKMALRMDPNIIEIGEIRDEEVAKIAFRAAYTGHLVLTTLHTNDVASTFARLSDLGVEAYNQGGLIRCICSQQLVKRLCLNCKEDDPKTSLISAHIIEKFFSEREDIIEMLGDFSTANPFFKASIDGCRHCDFTGYKGRIAVAEVLEITPDLANMIPLGMRGEQAVELAIKEYGMLSFSECAFRKLYQGITSFAEVEPWLTAPPQKRRRQLPNKALRAAAPAMAVLTPKGLTSEQSPTTQV